VIGDGGLDTSVMIAGRTDGMNNYQDATRKEILASVKLRCVECGGKMHVMQFNHLRYDETLIGYCCQDCPHYNLLDDNPV
jgi:hypothetical protein